MLVLGGLCSASALMCSPAGRSSTNAVARSALPVAVARREACWLGVATAATALGRLPVSAAEAPLTASQLLTVGEYVNSLSSAQKSIKADLTPLLEIGEDRGYEAARITLRKPPMNGIRKACSKVVKLLEDNGASAVAAEKNKIYDSIKRSLAVIDDGCRPELASRPDFAAELAQLEKDLSAFRDGLGVAPASSLQGPE